MPIDLMLPRASKKPVTPTTAFSLSSAKVVAGSSRSTFPALSCAFSAWGRASTSTLRPTASAVFGLTPPPTPPRFSPAMALWSCSASPQNASSPNVSNRKIWRPSRTMRLAFSSITLSKPQGTDEANSHEPCPDRQPGTAWDDGSHGDPPWDGTEPDCNDYRYR